MIAEHRRSRYGHLPRVAVLILVTLALSTCSDISVLTALKAAELVVKGVPQWAQTLTAGTDGAKFLGVAVDAAGNVYAAGLCDTATFGFGNGITVTGTSSTGNVLLVKYNSSGQAQWARTLASGTVGAYFSSVAVDSSGNVYAAGYSFAAGTIGSATGSPRPAPRAWTMSFW